MKNWLKSIFFSFIFYFAIAGGFILYGFFDYNPLKDYGTFFTLSPLTLFLFFIFLFILDSEKPFEKKVYLKIAISYGAIWLASPILFFIWTTFLNGQFSNLYSIFRLILQPQGFFRLFAYTYLVGFFYVIFAFFCQTLIQLFVKFLSNKKIFIVLLAIIFLTFSTSFFLYISNGKCVTSDYWCIANNAVADRNLGLCDKFDNLFFEQSEKENCYSNYALKMGDYSPCELLEKEISLRMKTEYYAEGTFQEEQKIGRCFKEAAVSLENESLCSKATHLEQECYYELAIKTKNPSLCLNISYLPYRVDCCGRTYKKPKDYLNYEEKASCGI